MVGTFNNEQACCKTFWCEVPSISDFCIADTDEESNEPKNRSYSLMDLGYGDITSLWCRPLLLFLCVEDELRLESERWYRRLRAFRRAISAPPTKAGFCMMYSSAMARD